jgi:hypothetical protein
VGRLSAIVVGWLSAFDARWLAVVVVVAFWAFVVVVAIRAFVVVEAFGALVVVVVAFGAFVVVGWLVGFCCGVGCRGGVASWAFVVGGGVLGVSSSVTGQAVASWAFVDGGVLGVSSSSSIVRDRPSPTHLKAITSA